MIKKIFKENYLYLIVILFLIICFCIIMNSSLYDKIIILDYKVIDFMKSIVDNKLTLSFRLVTYFGDIYIPIIILVCILLFAKNKYYFLVQFGGYLIAGSITFITKLLTARARPIEALISMPKSYSFPSGHTLTSLVFYSLLFYLITINCKKKTRIISFIISLFLISMVAISRIYLGVHYFTDVIGGFVLGIICILMIINIVEKNFKEKLK